MTAVAVWSQLPSKDQLLQQRLADGWRPTTSALQAGDKVMGFAACLWEDNSQCPLAWQFWSTANG